MQFKEGDDATPWFKCPQNSAPASAAAAAPVTESCAWSPKLGEASFGHVQNIDRMAKAFAAKRFYVLQSEILHGMDELLVLTDRNLKRLAMLKLFGFSSFDTILK